MLSRLFRRLFLAALTTAFDHRQLQCHGELRHLQDRAAFTAYLQPLHRTEWVVYAKPPFGGPQQVLEYLGRYTHRVAISNERLCALDDTSVTFQWKDYRQPAQPKRMRLEVAEFIRRFLLHVLPPGFQRIRHCGWMANRHRKAKLAVCRNLINAPVTQFLPSPECCQQMRQTLHSVTSHPCPQCGQGEMTRVQTLSAYRWPVRPPDTS